MSYYKDTNLIIRRMQEPDPQIFSDEECRQGWKASPEKYKRRIADEQKGIAAALTAEYKGVTLIENPYWDSCNNIASLYVAREQLENAMILDGDQIIYKKEILAPEFTHSGYNAVWTDEKTDEWLMQVKDGIVCSCSRTGGKGGWQLFSVSRWNREDGKRLKRHLELEFEKKQNRQIYWDDVAMFCHFEEYELGIYPMQEGDLIEIDDFSELCDLDPSYCGYEAQGQEKSEEK